MKKNKKHIIDIDQLLSQSLDNNYEPSASFVDDVMTRVSSIDFIKPTTKYLKIVFQTAAACACIVFISNVVFLLSSTKNGNQTENDWAAVYELSSSANWYEYYNDDTFIANNLTNE